MLKRFNGILDTFYMNSSAYSTFDLLFLFYLCHWLICLQTTAYLFRHLEFVPILSYVILMN